MTSITEHVALLPTPAAEPRLSTDQVDALVLGLTVAEMRTALRHLSGAAEGAFVAAMGDVERRRSLLLAQWRESQARAVGLGVDDEYRAERADYDGPDWDAAHKADLEADLDGAEVTL